MRPILDENLSTSETKIEDFEKRQKQRKMIQAV